MALLGGARPHRAARRTVRMPRRGRPAGTEVLILTLLAAAASPFLAAQTQPATRTSFESSAPEGYTAVTLSTGGRVWGVPERYTSDSDPGTVAYMLLGALKGCDFADAEARRRSKVYITRQSLGTLSGYEARTACRKTSSRWTTTWAGVRMTRLLFFDESSPTNTREATYSETTGQYSIDMSTRISQLSFPEGPFTTRYVAENSLAGVNVGSPVSAVGIGSLAYTLSGTDAGSFSIVAGTGQIRTKEGVIYDYETKNRYSVTIGVEDGSGNTDTIAVAIEIEDLGPSCMAPPDFRTIAGDRSVTLRWTPLEDTEGNARVWGYQVGMRRGSNGIWGTTRTLLGRGVTGTAYTDLLNATPSQFRIRPLQAEGECEWQESEIVRPQIPQRAPRDPDEHFRRVGRRPVGTPERNYRFLSPDRCRYTAGGSTLDATCRYANTGPSSGTITLEFDDASQLGCDVSLAYSSLTAGSFHDACFGAGVRIAVDFDTSFRLVPLPGEEEQDVPRAPRSQEEFDVLVWGRDDLIPGLGFGLPPMFVDRSYAPGHAYTFEWSEEHRKPLFKLGTYTYQSSGSSQGILRYQGDLGETYVFTLDFLPSGRMQVTVTDTDGGSPGWPGMPETLLQGSSLPVLLPIPPSWSAAIEIETDVAPVDIEGFEERIPTPTNPELPDAPRFGLFQSHLLGDIWDRAFENPGGETSPIAHDWDYRKIGRNRAAIAITWEHSGQDEGTPLTPLQQSLLGSTWIFDITFRTPDSGIIKLTIRREGSPPITLRRFLDLKSGISSTDTFPTELLLPDDPPQESGQDITGVQIAPVITPAGIGQNDIQTFLVHNAGPQPASYSPGDWLEPKDGGDQRMMVVASGQPAPAGPSAQARPDKLRGPAMSARLGDLVELLPYRSPGPPPPRQQAVSPSLTPISVVCMQRERDVPLRGARYFSQSKAAEGEVQLCQKNCATAGGEAIQRCVWDCETDPSGETYAPTPVWTVRAGQVRLANLTAGGCIAHNAITSSKWQRRDDENSPWSDLPGTEQTGRVCSYSPAEAGQYRSVGILEIDGNVGRYASNNILTVEGSLETSDRQPSFGTATVSNQTYTAGTRVAALTLPAASGGDGTLSYSLAPSVPGLTFTASTRHLTGTPTSAGTYNMSYVARDADGDTATLSFILTVNAAATGAEEVDEYTPLESWIVSDGTVQFLFFRAGGCIRIGNTTINGVTYTIHSSKWQQRAVADRAWMDIPGTENTGSLCAHSPTEPGQYRGVAEISINGERGKYSTKNVLTVGGG